MNNYENESLRIRAWSAPYWDSVQLICTERRQGKLFVGEVIMHEQAPEVAGPPTAELNQHCAQELMDDLWRCGLRPSEGSGSAGSLAATERHLNDVRQIAFSLLKLEPSILKRVL